MSLKVLVVPDKFKGTLTAHAAADAIARGWRKSRPRDRLELLPMTDGGDGFGEVMSVLLGAKLQAVTTIDAAHWPGYSCWWWNSKTRTAIIESAEVIALSKHRGFHPFELDTFGLGAVLQAARKAGAKRCLVGIGGSATNDGGFGLAHALGWKFLDDDGLPIQRWTELHALRELVPPKQKLHFKQLIVAVDVQNPLLGPRGATRVYGPQKGFTQKDFALAEKCLGKLAQVAGGASKPGDGAAGGLGFGLRNFAGAKLKPGFELFAREAGLMRRLKAADLVITGEGAIDHSTFMGKGVGQIARTCKRLGIPCIGLAGTMTSRKLFTRGYALTDLTSPEKATRDAALWLERLSSQATRSESKL